MAFCTNCGEQAVDIAQYCNNCGAKIDRSQQPPDYDPNIPPQYVPPIYMPPSGNVIYYNAHSQYQYNIANNISGTVELYKNNYKTIIQAYTVYALVISAISILIFQLFFSDFHRNFKSVRSEDLMNIFVIIMFVFFSFVPNTVAIRLVGNQVEQKEEELSNSFKYVFGKLGHIFLLGIIVTAFVALVTVGLVLAITIIASMDSLFNLIVIIILAYIILLIYFGSRISLAYSIIVIEDLGAVDAIKRSLHLTKNNVIVLIVSGFVIGIIENFGYQILIIPSVILFAILGSNFWYLIIIIPMIFISCLRYIHSVTAYYLLLVRFGERTPED